MNIHIAKDTLFLNESITSIKNELDKCIQSFYPENKLINELQIIKYNDSLGFYGKVMPEIINNELKFNIIYSDIIVNWFCTHDADKYVYAKSIIYHELYHLKEMSYTCNYIPRNILFLRQNISTHDVILDFALHQWSEYYAYRLSSEIDTESHSLKNKIINTHVCLSVALEYASFYTTVSIPVESEQKIANYIATCVREIAFYHGTNNISFLKPIYQYNDTYPNECKYYLFLEKLLNEKWKEYPTKISEEWLLEFGKSLFYIYKLYHLDFSTEDLSDNFVFKYIP